MENGQIPANRLDLAALAREQSYPNNWPGIRLFLDFL
jgi:hypothetical protein